MQKIYVLWLWLGLSVCMSAQTVTVLDVSSDEPIELVSIYSERPRAFTSTDENGQADLSGFEEAEHIDFQLLGYQTYRTTYPELEANGFVVRMQSYSLKIGTVVVSATRWRQSSGKVPYQIATISPRETALQNPQTAADLLGVSGKVYIQKSQQGGGSPMIRGFATNRLLYTIDGVRMNTAIFRGGNIQNVISLDPFALSGTEVLFGPNSVIYGSDAIGGVMSFQTLEPKFTEEDAPLVSGSALGRYASANEEKTGHFDVNIGWKKFALVTSFSSYQYDHLRQGSNGPDDYLKPYYVQQIDSIDRVINQADPLLQIPSAYNQINLMQKARFHPNENWDFTYGFHFSETSPYGRYDRHNRVRDGYPRYGQWDYGPQKWQMHLLNIDHLKATPLYDQWSMRLAQQYFGESRISRNFNDSERSTQVEEVQAQSINWDFVRSLNDRHTLRYGVEYVRNEVNSSGTLTDITDGTEKAGPSRYPQASWQAAGIYLNEDFSLSEFLNLQGGLRYSWFGIEAQFDTTFYPFPFSEASLNNGSLTGTIGGVLRPNDNLVITANLATAFRSPNIDDIGKVFDSEPGAVTVPNPKLKPEYALSADIGVAKVFSDQVKIDFSAYYTQLENAMVRRNFTLNGQDSILFEGVPSQVQAIQNAAVANVYGLQAGLEVKLPAGFRLVSDFNYQVGEEELDDGSISPSRHAAPWFGRTRLSYARKGMNWQFYAVYQGERRHEDLAIDEQGKTEIYALDENGNTYSPAWYTLNIKTSIELTDHIFVSAGVENITDQRYRPYSSGISGAGRNFILSTRFSF